MSLPFHQSLRVLPLLLADFAAAALFYLTISRPLGALLGAVAVLLLGSVVYQVALSARRRSRSFHS